METNQTKQLSLSPAVCLEADILPWLALSRTTRPSSLGPHVFGPNIPAVRGRVAGHFVGGCIPEGAGSRYTLTHSSTSRAKPPAAGSSCSHCALIEDASRPGSVRLPTLRYALPTARLVRQSGCAHPSSISERDSARSWRAAQGERPPDLSALPYVAALLQHRAPGPLRAAPCVPQGSQHLCSCSPAHYYPLPPYASRAGGGLPPAPVHYQSSSSTPTPPVAPPVPPRHYSSVALRY